MINYEIGFGSQRLAILDLPPNGHQPMWFSDDCFTVEFTGEIFNYSGLPYELLAKKLTIKPSGDSQNSLAAYIEWGNKYLRRFIGMWACLIVDN